MIYNIKTTGTGIKICICDKTDCNKGSPFFVGLQPDQTERSGEPPTLTLQQAEACLLFVLSSKAGWTA